MPRAEMSFNWTKVRGTGILIVAKRNRDPARMGDALGTPHLRLGAVVVAGLDQRN